MDFSTSEIIEYLFDLDLLRSAAIDTTWFTVGIAAILAPFFYSIEFVWNFSKHTVTNLGTKPKFFDKVELIRGMVIWFMIGAYIPIFGSIERIAYVITESSTPDQYLEWKMNHAELISEVPTETEEIGDAENPVLDDGLEEKEDNLGLTDLTAAVVSVKFGMADMMSGMLRSALSGLITGLGFIVSIIVAGLSLMIGKVMFVLGPLALVFSLLTPFRDKMGRWFGVWLLLLMNPLTVNVLNALLMSVTYEQFESATTAHLTYTSGIGVLLFNVIIIICYILTFWLTSMYVGSPDAGKVLSTAAGMATMAMMSGMKMMGGAGKLGGAGGAVKDVISSGQPK